MESLLIKSTFKNTEELAIPYNEIYKKILLRLELKSFFNKENFHESVYD